MAVYKSRRGSRHSPAVMMAAMMLVAAVILINANCGGAVVLVRSNVTYGCITGLEEACLIAEDLELEWLMEYSSHVSRVLAAADPDPATSNANNGGNAACHTGPNGSYSSGPNCSTDANPKQGENAGIYNRGKPK